MKVHLCACEKTEISCIETQTGLRINQSSVRVCVFQTFCNISSIFLSFKLLLVTLPSLTPILQQINMGWLMMWFTLHVSLYRKALCITTMGDQRRGREQGEILKCSIVFSALNLKKNLQSHFVLKNSTFPFCKLKYGKSKRKHRFFDTLGLFADSFCGS